MAAVALLMATWWITDAIPLFATALLPLLLYPLLGIEQTRATAPVYFNSTIVLFLGGFMIALTMEKWDVHRRIALRVIRSVGGGPARIVLGFMLAAAFLSMWISNTATAIMMIPVGLAVILRMEEQFGRERTRAFSVAIMLGIAYACSAGGIATLVGTPAEPFPGADLPDHLSGGAAHIVRGVVRHGRPGLRAHARLGLAADHAGLLPHTCRGRRRPGGPRVGGPQARPRLLRGAGDPRGVRRHRTPLGLPRPDRDRRADDSRLVRPSALRQPDRRRHRRDHNGQPPLPGAGPVSRREVPHRDGAGRGARAALEHRAAVRGRFRPRPRLPDHRTGPLHRRRVSAGWARCRRSPSSSSSA